jgi:lipid-binding SYLF domain-containing protein
MKFVIRLVSFLTLIALLSGCIAPGGSVDSRRRHIDNMSQQALKDLYRIRPSARNEIEQAAGYAVFSNVNVNVVFVGGGSGYGVVRDQRGNTRTYMKMGEASVGLGLGAKDFRAVLIFDNAGTMKRFITEGWTFGLNADAAARSKAKGAAAASEIVADSIRIYQITEGGLLLNASLKGAKFWTDDELNGVSRRATVQDNSNSATSSMPSGNGGANSEGGTVDYSEPIPVW